MRPERSMCILSHIHAVVIQSRRKRWMILMSLQGFSFSFFSAAGKWYSRNTGTRTLLQYQHYDWCYIGNWHKCMLRRASRCCYQMERPNPSIWTNGKKNILFPHFSAELNPNCFYQNMQISCLKVPLFGTLKLFMWTIFLSSVPHNTKRGHSFTLWINLAPSAPLWQSQSFNW